MADTAGIATASGASTRPDGAIAADEVCDAIRHAGIATPDVTFVFASPHHADVLGGLCDRIATGLGTRHVLGCTAGAVLGATGDMEGAPGLSVLACSLPKVRVVPFTSDALIAPDASPEAAAAAASETVGAADDLRAVVMFADPYSVPLVRLLPALNAGRVECETPEGRKRMGTIIGGMASGAARPGGNAIVLDGKVSRHGAAGLSLLGNLRVDTIVSQGCRPVGPTMVVTRARSNLVLELAGRPALDVVRETIGELPTADRNLLAGGLFLGRVVDEYKDRFGRGDFLIRHIVGAEESSGAIAVADLMRVGQTVQLHLRDRVTAKEDLELLLDAQRLHDPPAGALLLTCNGRGKAFFNEQHADVSAVQRAFRAGDSGAARAKAGRTVGPVEPSVPMAGFFAAGEIGPVGDDSYLHGHTASLALLRSPDHE
ncbi:MAG: FIST N-terminal domain-containing protein [Phycisphaerales bacterium]